jgi:pimeloyl-ACP methyl ester carboxylesterase
MRVFILHGWTYSTDKWIDLCNLLQTAKIEPVLLKIPGLSEPSNQVWDIVSYVHWLDEKLKDEVKPILIGHSNGGRIALAYAQEDPKRPSQLILIDSAGVAHDSESYSLKRKIFRIMAKVGKPLGYIPGIKKIFYKLIGGMDYYNAPPNMKKTMQNMLNGDKDINLSAINLPVTLIWGDQDQVTPISDAYTMVQNLPQANLHIINGATHSPQFTNTAEVAEIIKKVLKT